MFGSLLNVSSVFQLLELSVFAVLPKCVASSDSVHASLCAAVRFCLIQLLRVSCPRLPSASQVVS